MSMLFAGAEGPHGGPCCCMKCGRDLPNGCRRMVATIQHYDRMPDFGFRLCHSCCLDAQEVLSEWISVRV